MQNHTSQASILKHSKFNLCYISAFGSWAKSKSQIHRSISSAIFHPKPCELSLLANLHGKRRLSYIPAFLSWARLKGQIHRSISFALFHTKPCKFCLLENLHGTRKYKLCSGQSRTMWALPSKQPPHMHICMCIDISLLVLGKSGMRKPYKGRRHAA